MLAGVLRGGELLAGKRVDERLAMIDAVLAEALVAAAFERGAGRIRATGPGVRRAALEDTRVRFLGLLT